MIQMVETKQEDFRLAKGALFRERCYIDGEWRDADSGASMPVSNPATGQQIGSVPRMGAAETRRAIQAAHLAFEPWRAKTA